MHGCSGCRGGGEWAAGPPYSDERARCHLRGGEPSISTGRRCCSSAGRYQARSSRERARRLSGCVTDDAGATASEGCDATSCYTSSYSGGPLASWQEDLSRKLDGVMRKLHM